MFSGIHSLIFGKKNHHKNRLQTNDDSAIDTSTQDDNSFIARERRHSDEPDIPPGLYPKINPLPSVGGNLPYGISPSLPDLRPQNNIERVTKEGSTVDFLHGVPFELASYIDIMTTEKEEKLVKLLQRFEDQLPEDGIGDGYDYDFNLENRILSEFET